MCQDQQTTTGKAMQSKAGMDYATNAFLLSSCFLERICVEGGGREEAIHSLSEGLVLALCVALSLPTQPPLEAAPGP